MAFMLLLEMFIITVCSFLKKKKCMVLYLLYVIFILSVCSLLKKGVYGIIGISNTSALATIQSYSNTFKVPFIALNMAQNSSNHGPFQIFMKPMYINGLLDVIVKYGWTKLLYLYDTDEGMYIVFTLITSHGIQQELGVEVPILSGIFKI